MNANGTERRKVPRVSRCGLILDCVECGLRFPTKAKGLCSACFKDEEILIKYGLRKRGTGAREKGREALHGIILSPAHTAVRHREPARTPTQARPGTPEKIEVMEAREANNEELWHPEDAK